jgi:lipoic acid synthetase
MAQEISGCPQLMGRGLQKPAWLRRGIPSGEAHGRLRAFLEAGGLRTVCDEARCPNRQECFSCGTATFLILGDTCTRRCRFCAVHQGTPRPPDPDEPGRVAAAAAGMGLTHVVVTSVTRDDLPDGGAGLFAATLRALRARLPAARVELLVPDFAGDDAALGTVLAAGPDVLNHNLETVARLYGAVRPGADYGRSLALLRRVAEAFPGIAVKSGLMLGLGERPEEVAGALRDLRAAGCTVLTVGQYLPPTGVSLPAARYLPPEEFDRWRDAALGLGFAAAASGPFVRSSYRAESLDRQKFDDK